MIANLAGMLPMNLVIVQVGDRMVEQPGEDEGDRRDGAGDDQGREIVLLAALAVPAASADLGHDHGPTKEEAHGDRAGGGHGHGHGRGFAAGGLGESGEVDRTIRIETQDIAFDEERIEVSAGETIRFVVENSGELVHDFAIGRPDMQAAHRDEMAELMAHHDGPDALMDP